MDANDRILPALPYQRELRSYLKASESEVWAWFASTQARTDFAEQSRLELLKSTYRLDAEGHPELYRVAEEARAKLGLEIPLTLYQSQAITQLNAALCPLPGEGHVIFSGPVISLLKPEELKSVIGHELAHYLLWDREAGEFLIADRMLMSAANDSRAEPSHVQSARWYRLYTEIFADRGSLLAAENLETVVSGLVKLHTGMAEVSGASYLKQAEEIFKKTKVKTEGLSHPEIFIRARALALWARDGDEADGEISAMIEGAAALDELDLVGQTRVTALTRRLLEELLRPKWFQTPAVLGHAKMFFADFRPAKTRDVTLAEEYKFNDPKLREYLCYLLLDFVVADPELEDMPLVAALELARALDLSSPFEKCVTKELRMKARDLKKLKEQAAAMLAQEETRDGTNPPPKDGAVPPPLPIETQEATT